MTDAVRPAVRGKWWALIALTLVLTTLVAAPGANAATKGCFNETGTKTVALDPGHGGSDTGTSGTTSWGQVLVEKDLTLDIANRTRDILVGYGYRVCLTRTDDTNLTNTQRAQYANSVGGQVFVLIHLNGSSDPNLDYTKTFWGKKNKDEQFSHWMHDALYAALGIADGGVGQFASGALLKSTMPATLTESVFLTNRSEADRLADLSASGRRQQIAGALANGINTWLGGGA